MPKNKSQQVKIPEVHPVILALEGSGQRAVELRGYLGKASRGHIRLYRDLDMNSYTDISKDGVVHLENEACGGRVRVWVLDTTAVSEVRIEQAKDAAVDSTNAQLMAMFLKLQLEDPLQDPETSNAINEATKKLRCMTFCELLFPKGSASYLECISKC